MFACRQRSLLGLINRLNRANAALDVLPLLVGNNSGALGELLVHASNTTTASGHLPLGRTFSRSERELTPSEESRRWGDNRTSSASKVHSGSDATKNGQCRVTSRGSNVLNRRLLDGLHRLLGRGLNRRHRSSDIDRSGQCLNRLRHLGRDSASTGGSDDWANHSAGSQRGQTQRTGHRLNKCTGEQANGGELLFQRPSRCFLQRLVGIGDDVLYELRRLLRPIVSRGKWLGGPLRRGADDIRNHGSRGTSEASADAVDDRWLFLVDELDFRLVDKVYLRGRGLLFLHLTRDGVDVGHGITWSSA